MRNIGHSFYCYNANENSFCNYYQSAKLGFNTRKNTYINRKVSAKLSTDRSLRLQHFTHTIIPFVTAHCCIKN